MLSRLLLIFITGLLLGLTPAASQTYNQSTVLLTQLFTGYDRDVRPLYNQSLTLNVTMATIVKSLENVNEKDQTIALRTYLMLTWKDELLTWDPQDYGNLEFINPGVDRAWLPPFNLAGQISESQALVDTSLVTPLRVRYDGYVSWFPNVRLVQTCNMDMTYFPNDEHSCIFELYVLMYTLDQVYIVLADSKPDESSFIENGEWKLLSSSWVSLPYSAGNDTFQVIDMSVKIKRRPRFFLMNLLFPTLALSFLNILVFVLPADSGEKVGYSITVLLSVMLMMGVTTDSMPASSQLPLITQFIAVLVAISVLSVVATVISLFVHHKIDGKKKEETKALSVLHKWKGKLGKKLLKPLSAKQVHPAQQDLQKDGQDSQRHHETKDSSYVPPVVPFKTYLSTKPDNSRLNPAHGVSEANSLNTFDVDKQRPIEAGESICIGNGGLIQSKCLTPCDTVEKGSGTGGLASLWYRGRPGVNSDPTPRPDQDLSKKDTKLDNKKKADDFLTLVQVYLDVILFWLFLITWIAVTIGFSVAIFK